MKRSIRSAALLLVFTMLFSGVAGTTAQRVGAQSTDVEPDFYVSELSDFEIEVTDDEFQIFDAELQEYEHGEGEIVQISSTSAQVQIAFYDDSDTNQDTLDIYNDSFSGQVDDFEVLDEGVDGDTVYSFAVATYNDVQFFYYLSVTEDVEQNVDLLQRIYSPDTSFIDDVEAAQDSITIGGDGFLEDVDTGDLASLADLPSAGEDEPEGTEEDDPDVTEEDDPEPTVEGDPEDAPDSGTRGSLSGETYEFELADAEIVLGDDVTVANVLLEEPVVEQVQLQLATSESAGAVQLMQMPMNAEGVLDSLLGNFSSGVDSLENLGTDADRTTAWSLDRGVLNGQETLIYIWVDEGRYDDFHYVELLIAPEATFVSDLQALNENVEIDGVAMYADTDIDMIESLLEGGTPPADDDAGDDSDRGNDDAKTDTDDRGDDDDRNNRDVDDDEGDVGTGDLDLESQGLVSDTEFESLQYGFVVEWDDAAWAIDPEWELSAVSDPETGVDSVILFWQDGGASMMIQILPSEGGDTSDYLDLWESDDFIVDSVHEDAEVLLADSGRDSAAVVYLSYDDDGQEVILVQEVVDLDGGDTVAVITMFGSTESVADAYADAEDLVTVGDEDAVGTFTSREIENAVAP